MKFSSAILAAVLVTFATATPVVETRNSTEVLAKRAHAKRGAAYNTAGAIVPMQSS
jgi:hypothetical protein